MFMDVCHGTWVPASGADFDNQGQFVFWVETPAGASRKNKAGIHPHHLSKTTELEDFLTSSLSFNKALLMAIRPQPATVYATLPTHAEQPLPSMEMAQFTGEYPPDEYAWQVWTINGLAMNQPLLFLRELQFIASVKQPGFRLGSDLLFWIQYAQQWRNVIRQHQFLPVMKCHQPAGKKAPLRLYNGWSPVASLYERGLQDFAAAMPGVCTTVSRRKPATTEPVDQPECWDSLELLRHFSEQQLEALMTGASITKQVLKQLEGSWLVDALGDNTDPALTVEQWQQWYAWQRAIVGQVQDASFVLGLRLQATASQSGEAWWLSFFVESSQDPSLKMELSEWWALSTAKQKQWQQQFGQQFERNLLVNMGHAARMCPLLWQGMESPQPTGLSLDLQTAYEFLKNDAAVLEAAGFKIALPSWWTPQGRKRARIRIKASVKSAPSQEKNSGTGYFSLPSLVQYHYELSVGGETVTEQEWQALVNAKTPLVQFRGEWMELDRAQMDQLLALWQQQQVQPEGDAASIRDLLKHIAEADDTTTEFVFDEVLDNLLERLQQPHHFTTLDNPAGFQGQLRVYQQQGLSWLATQEALGLNPCLADDMGLGKTIQVIALLLHERTQLTPEQQATLAPTLLIAPTSVLSNWQKELEKFAPQLRSLIHHGSDRADKPKIFKEAAAVNDVVITSFTIARKDSLLLKQQHWHRIVVDEAQNIKNPKSAQAKAIYALDAPHRIAMTGTPIENRLMDMWSLFHFLTPGYLGNATQFKRAYETPIQRDGDMQRASQLQRLIQPFILRRLKTDKSIIDDLPDKVEQKVYCNLTKEQASLYQAVVDDVQQQLEDAEGIQRKGLILSTLMKLKQVCNHPAQFLQDGSAFSETRSHKLARLNEMVEEALEESDSLLLFTQFTDIGGQLEQLLRGKHACPVYYLHGGTSRKHREQMIETFQNTDTPAGIFILSLKAGGVGITLTRANHVFHFDRWWNPAVENQATDRAYRIGQQKTVFAHKMVTLGTLEERIDKMLEDKQALADSIVGTDEGWLTEMDNAAFRQLIQLNRSTIMEA